MARIFFNRLLIFLSPGPPPGLVTVKSGAGS
jgi:hypothetical protein